MRTKAISGMTQRGSDGHGTSSQHVRLQEQPTTHVKICQRKNAGCEGERETGRMLGVRGTGTTTRNRKHEGKARGPTRADTTKNGFNCHHERYLARKVTWTESSDVPQARNAAAYRSPLLQGRCSFWSNVWISRRHGRDQREHEVSVGECLQRYMSAIMYHATQKGRLHIRHGWIA